MNQTLTKPRGAWIERFAEPTIDDLLKEVDENLRMFVDVAREKLSASSEVVEEVMWKGIPWRWTIVYRLEQDPRGALAYLILEPEKPQLAFTLTTEMIEALPLHRMKKHVRDGVLMAREVAGTYWASWDIANKTQVLDIMELVRRKHKLLTSPPKAKASD